MADITANVPLVKALPVKKKIEWSNVAVGAAVSLFEVTTLGQPLEVAKTQMAANRGQSLRTALSKIYSNGGVKAYWRGLIPWAWIESGFAGATLLFTAAEIETRSIAGGISPGIAGLLGGVGGGIAQGYLVMSWCTTMKTAEVTRARTPGVPQLGTFALFRDILRREGPAGVLKGGHAVAMRQATNWGSRIGIARVAEGALRKSKGLGEKDKLGNVDKVIASSVGGALGCWNHPIEVTRVEMQSMLKDPNKPSNLGTFGTMSYIYRQNGIGGLFRGVSPRVGLSVYRTVCLVALGDFVREWVAGRKKAP